MNDAPHSDTAPPDAALQQDELVRRVIYAMLAPAVRLALAFQIPIKDLGDLVQMAYFHEVRRRGLKMRQASDILGVSMRKVALLSRRLKQNFLQEETQEALPRRLEFMLWAEPLSEARLRQVIGDVDDDEITAALQRLEAQGRVRLVPGRTPTWEVVRSEFRLVRDTWLARIDGLNNLLGSVANAVFGRFFRDEERAFARTLSLRIRPEDLERLRALYDEHIYPTLRDLDAAAHGDDEAEEIDVSIIWAPYEYLPRHTTLPGDEDDDRDDEEDDDTP